MFECEWEIRGMESDLRFYLRRAAEERTAALRSVTPSARDWHEKLARDFAERANQCQSSVSVREAVA